jgi:hypothetical protein
MQDLLVQHELQKALAGKSKKPTAMTELEWEDMDAKDLSTIRLCLADDALFNVVGKHTTSGLWSKLESLYMTKSLTSRIYLKRQLYSLRMKEGTKVIDHLNTFNTLIVQLTSMEVKFEDEDKAITLLCLLPESWDNLVTSISFRSTKVLDYDYVVGALLVEEMRTKSSKETSTSEAMLIRGRTIEKNERSSFQSKSRHKKGKEKCWYCGKTWHLKKYCWKRKESKENSTKEANLVVTNSGMTDQVLSISSNLQYQEEWQLDSAASHHMCSHRNWFISYQSVDEGVVFMGNGIPCKIVGVGSIRIRMFDGIVRELTNVRYVPELKSNLISLGVLDSCGYKYTSQGGALTLSKSSLVVMKATKVDNLYKLEGSTEVASEVTDVSSCLW